MLSGEEIRREMCRGDDPLTVTPLLQEGQIGEASVDVRLGHEFIILQRTSVSHLDPTNHQVWDRAIYRSQERVRIRTFTDFILHPGDLVLGATLEYVSIPRTLAASVEGRSSWGRLGLIIATASTIAPGFKGCITLELVNSGRVPLSVCPGMRIAQLVFQRLTGEAAYRGKYPCPTGPQFSRLNRDPEIRVWHGDH